MWKTRMSVGALAATSLAVGVPLAPVAAAPLGTSPAAPVVGVVPAPTSQGYWEVSSDGGIFSFGAAQFHGSVGGHPLDRPIVGMVATPDGRGYWEVSSDGGIFSFGAAQFHGAMGGRPLDQPIVGMAATPDGRGYWLVAADGGIFAFGDAAFHGSMGGHPLGQPIVGMAAARDGQGYWEVASDGGVFAFGDAPFHGSAGGQAVGSSVVSMAAGSSGTGYWEVAASGTIDAFGTASASYGMVTGAAVGGGTIATIAASQVGNGDPYAYGPLASTWCAYFASWVWARAGVPIPATGPAASIGTWAMTSGGTILPPSATPAPGDAVLWVSPGTAKVWPDAAALNMPNIQHVNIVTQVLPGGGIVTVGGNESGAVRQVGPYSPASASSYFGQTIYGYVQPPG
ncbi:MAG: CHAP domain-containing protein [Acidimicrobiales bacterium]